MRSAHRNKKRLDWVVVANAARARCFERDPDNNALRELTDLVHPPSRLKGRALSDDRDGHALKGAAASTQFQPRTDPHSKEHALFAREVATFVESGAAAGHFERLCLIASATFLGELRAHLGEHSRSRLHVSAALDLTIYSGSDLEHRVAQAIVTRPGSDGVPAA